jgi:hypothetical protein
MWRLVVGLILVATAAFEVSGQDIVTRPGEIPESSLAEAWQWAIETFTPRQPDTPDNDTAFPTPDATSSMCRPDRMTTASCPEPSYELDK